MDRFVELIAQSVALASLEANGRRNPQRHDGGTKSDPYSRPAGRPNRRSIRLKGYDYSQPGAYFVTIVIQDRACLFDEVVDGEMPLNEWGEIVMWTWRDLPNHVPDVQLDAFLIMPNHVHGIIVITDVTNAPAPVWAGSEPAHTHSISDQSIEPIPGGIPAKRHALPEIVRQFKTFSARRINERRGTPSARVWQRNYYKHIIRNKQSLNRICQYVAGNPQQWAFDRENPAVLAPEPEDAWTH